MEVAVYKIRSAPCGPRLRCKWAYQYLKAVKRGARRRVVGLATHGVVVDLHALLARSRLSGEVQVRITGGNTPAFGHLTNLRA